MKRGTGSAAENALVSVLRLFAEVTTVDVGGKLWISTDKKMRVTALI